MKRKELLKYLKENHTVSNGRSPFQYQVEINNTVYNLLFIKTNEHKQVTINSPKVVEVASGKLDGVRYQKRSSIFYRWSDQNQHVLLCLSHSPYRILKYINENEVVDISSEKHIHNIQIIRSIHDIQSIKK